MKHRPADKTVLRRHIFRVYDRRDIGAGVFRLGPSIVAFLGAAETESRLRRKTLYADLRRHLGEVFRRLAMQKESQIEEKGHLMPHDVHMMISIPPKYAVSRVVGYIKGKNAIHWRGSRGNGSAISWASTSGPQDTTFPPWDRTSKRSANTSRNQEQENKRLEQLNL
jgi:putative transposase